MGVVIDRGNDYEAADAEVRQQYGDVPNATDLLANRRALIDRETVAASMKREDEAATEAFDLESIKVPKGHTVLSATVRGTAREGQRVVYVADDGTGRWYKSSVPFEG